MSPTLSALRRDSELRATLVLISSPKRAWEKCINQPQLSLLPHSRLQTFLKTDPRTEHRWAGMRRREQGRWRGVAAATLLWFNPSWCCQGPTTCLSLTHLVHARHPEKAHWTRCTAHVYYSTLPAFLVFKQAWRNKSALGWEHFCLIFHSYWAATRTFQKKKKKSI